ncbi:MAG: patatin-like phospholipase family protein [Acidobacteria bacterium]|nr:patatin-like phospholipase family protein [Acidobacteriota bacterium]
MQRESKALLKAVRAFWGRWREEPLEETPGIGLALGGGFSRGIAHIGVLRVLERERIPVRYVAGVSAGAIVAAGFAAGADSHALERVARSMRFKDVARFSLSKLGLVGSDRMEGFLRRAFRVHRFEDMSVPLAIVATDLRSGEPVIFHTEGEIFPAVRASCSYPGLFQPVRHKGRVLVDGAISMEIPAQALRDLGVRRVVSVALPPPAVSQEPGSMFAVVNRSFQIMQQRTEAAWRRHSDVVITPLVNSVAWDDFTQVERLIEAGAQAAEESLPKIREWMDSKIHRPAYRGTPRPPVFSVSAPTPLP